MAISGLPSWIGSQAVSETGQRSMYNARAALGLAGAGWMSEMAGKERTVIVNITNVDHNFNTGTLHQWMLNAAGGSWPAQATWRIIVAPAASLISMGTSNACMWFGGAINGKVIIENHGHIFGRGGAGGAITCGDAGCTQGGSAGGHAIYREPKITLEIINYGVIAGGGGGGGGGYTFSSAGGGRHYGQGGGGGAPYGAGGYTSGMNHPRPGSVAGYTDGGVGGTGGDSGEAHGGTGGALGANGGGAWGNNRANAGGGYAGNAIAGGGTIIWTVRGDIRGAVS